MNDDTIRDGEAWTQSGAWLERAREEAEEDWMRAWWELLRRQFNERQAREKLTRAEEDLRAFRASKGESHDVPMGVWSPGYIARVARRVEKRKDEENR